MLLRRCQLFILNALLVSSIILSTSTLSLTQPLSLRSVSDFSSTVSSFSLISPFLKNPVANNEVSVKGGTVSEEEKVIINGEFIISAISSNELHNGSILALHEAVLNISTHAKSCEIVSTTLDTHHRERRRNLNTAINVEGSSPSTYTFDISFRCTFYIDTALLHSPFNASYIQIEKIKEIKHYVEDHTFEKRIRHYALFSNATELLHATCDTITFNALEEEDDLHHGNDDHHTESDNSSSSPSSKVIGVILGTIFGIYFLFVAIFCGLKRYGVIFGGSSKINVSMEE
jgi:hypothetical protein